jgi:hypothetical protein
VPSCGASAWPSVQRLDDVAARELATSDSVEYGVPLRLELRDGEIQFARDVDVHQPAVRRPVAEALADGRAVVVEGRDRIEAGGPAIGVVAGEHLLVHVEEELTLAVLAPALPARPWVHEVPMAVMFVRERVAAQVLESRLAASGSNTEGC